MEEQTTVAIGPGPVRRSQTLAAMAAAMAKAQGEITGASKDKTNPHFKQSYADLASVWDACRGALAKNAIAVFQSPSAQGPKVTMTTLLAHSSGEWIESDLEMTAGQNTPQGIGSCITYARRYALASMVGVAPEDDDGNAASQPTQASRPQAVTRAPEGFADFLDAIEAVAVEGGDALKAFWTKAPAHLRKHLTDTDAARWERIKAKAAQAQVPA
jgi:hypothetical protein